MAAVLALLWAGVVGSIALIRLMAWSVPLGRDGYYYLLQIRCLLDTGMPYYPTAFELPLRLFALVGWLVDSPTNGMKISTAILLAACVLVIYALVLELTHGHIEATLSAILTGASSLSEYFVVEFVSNLFGTLMWFVFAWRFARWLRSRSVSHAAWAAVAAGVAVSAHRSSLLFVCAFLFFYLILVRSVPVPDTTSQVKVVATAMLCGTSLVLALPVALPAHAPLLIATLRPLPKLPFWGYSAAPEAIVVATLIPLACWGVRRSARFTETSSRMVFAIGLTCVTLTINPWGRYETGLVGVAERLALWNWLFLPVLVGVVVAICRELSGFLAKAGAIASVVAALVTVRVDRHPIGGLDSFLIERTALVSELPVILGTVPANATVIAEHGFEFMIAAETGLRTRSTVPTPRSASQSHFWFLRVGRALSQRLPNGSVALSRWAVIPDDELESWLTSLSAEERLDLAQKNPSSHLAQSLRRTGAD